MIGQHRMAGLLEGRSALVTGAGNGIGRATAMAMAQAGARVACADRDAAAVRETVARIAADGGRAMAVVADVTVAAEVEGMVAAALAAHGRLDCAFNNAGAAPHQVGSIAERTAVWSEAAFDRMLVAGLRSVWLCLRHQLPPMLAQGGGAIVNNASIAGLTGLPEASAYAAAKHGVVGLTRAAAVEYAADRVRVNAVCPGFVATRMTGPVRGLRGPALLARTPLHRFATPEEVAALVVWLCSSRASYVTGVAWPVDGGWTAA